jgi:hypothetical protein
MSDQEGVRRRDVLKGIGITGAVVGVEVRSLAQTLR